MWNFIRSDRLAIYSIQKATAVCVMKRRARGRLTRQIRWSNEEWNGKTYQNAWMDSHGHPGTGLSPVVGQSGIRLNGFSTRVEKRCNRVFSLVHSPGYLPQPFVVAPPTLMHTGFWLRIGQTGGGGGERERRDENCTAHWVRW